VERPAHARPHTTPRGASDDIQRGDVSTRQIALTFDGGSEANVVGEILDSLRAANVRATMFLTGQFMRLHPDWVRRMVADGHEVANHTDTHPHLTTYAGNHRQRTLPIVTREFLNGQLRQAAESFRTITGKAMAPFWRAPYGEHNREIRAWAAGAGYRHVSWTQGVGTAEDLDTRDWVADRSSHIYRSREEIATRILEFGNGSPEGLSGGIVLMHLNSNRQTDRPHDGLPGLLKALQGQGYRLVTISELLQRRGADQEQLRSALSPPVTDE
jgi:peptidoglycan/xylan/chitin deacetylase (PgdA/CDA1 family)